jgi:hypothetical protein
MISGNRDFKLFVETKCGTRLQIHLVAPTVQDKEAWISDISQCIDNIHMHSLLSPGIGGTSGGMFESYCSLNNNDFFFSANLLSAAHALKTDPRLFKDDVDIRFSRTLNSCKLPQVRYATPERLLQRLTDLRFLSIDFLNTFLLTYRVFTDGETVLNALKNVFYNPPSEPSCECDHQTDFLDIPYQDGRCASPRRTSGASSVSGYCSEGADRDRSLSGDSAGLRYRPRKISNPHSTLDQESNLTWIPEGESGGAAVVQDVETEDTEETAETVQQEQIYLTIPRAVTTSGSTDTIMENLQSGSTSPSNLSSVTLIGSTGSGGQDKSDNDLTEDSCQRKAPTGPLPERIPPKRPSRSHEIQATTLPPKLIQPIPVAMEFQPTKTIIQPPTPTAIKSPSPIFQSIDTSKKSMAESASSKLARTPTAPKVMMQTHFPSYSLTTSTTVTLTTTTTTISTASTTIMSKAMSPPHIGITTTSIPTAGMDRRPSVGCNVIPHAALCQHRYSLQLNGETGAAKVSLQQKKIKDVFFSNYFLLPDRW